MKYIVFDAGPIISLSMSGMLPLLEKLANMFDGKFILTPSVKREVLDRPMKTTAFRLEALRVAHLIEKGVLVMSNSVVSDAELLREQHRILESANSVYRLKRNNKRITILQDGEASCLAFAQLCACDCLLVVDERTTRMLFESHKGLEDLLQRKNDSKIFADYSVLKKLTDFRFIRSTELAYIAYKKGLVELGKGKDVLEAMLYALKYKGTTISTAEIKRIKNRVK